MREFYQERQEGESGIELEKVDVFSLPWVTEIKEGEQEAFDTVEDIIDSAGVSDGKIVFTGEGFEKKYCHEPISFDDEIVDLYGKKETVVQRGGTSRKEYITLNFSIGAARLLCTVMVREMKGKEITVSLLKEDPFQMLPPGLGQAVYKKILESAQALADRDGQPVLHTVSRNTQISETPMSEAKWNRIFLPILNKDGRRYVVDSQDPDVFTYTFRPKTERPRYVAPAESPFGPRASSS